MRLTETTSNHVRSPLDLFLDTLRSRAQEATRVQLGPLLGLRDAIDAYEVALRQLHEGALVQQVAGQQVQACEPADLDALREGVRSAAAEWLSCSASSSEAGPLKALGIDKTEEPTCEPVRFEEVLEAGRGDDDDLDLGDAESRPMSQQAVDEFLERMRAVPSVRPPDPGQVFARERQTLCGLLDAIGDVPELSGDVDVIEELERMESTCDERTRARWDTLGEATAHAWLTMLVARLRALRDRLVPGSSLHKRHKAVINLLPAYHSERGLRRFVNGMARDHQPQFGTWAEDARRSMKELRGDRDEAREPASERPRSVTRPRTRAIPAALDWPHRARASTMHVLLYGGTPREDSRLNIERALGIGELSWPESNKQRQLAALVEGLGRYDVVIMNRLVHHKESQVLVAAAKAVGTPFRLVGSYGIETVRQALEDMLDGQERARAG